MIYIGTRLNQLYAVVNSYNETLAYDAAVTWASRHDWTSKEQVDNLALDLTERFDKVFIGVDNGGSISPRFDIIEAPKVGDMVSMGFNGDCYPVGVITAISASMKVITAGDKRFYRRKESGVWKFSKTWSMIKGEHNDRNPHI